MPSTRRMRFMPGNEESSWLAEPLSTPRLRLRPTRPADRGPIIDLVTDDEVRAAAVHHDGVDAVLPGELWYVGQDVDDAGVSAAGQGISIIPISCLSRSTSGR